MMGQQARTESLFYYFRLEDQIPEDHLLRLIDQHIDLSFVRERLKNYYSWTGRPSIDPEVLLRLLLVGYFYGITSERRLLEEVRMHLAYRFALRRRTGTLILCWTRLAVAPRTMSAIKR
jgi:transposase